MEFSNKSRNKLEIFINAGEPVTVNAFFVIQKF